MIVRVSRNRISFGGTVACVQVVSHEEFEVTDDTQCLPFQNASHNLLIIDFNKFEYL